MGKIKCLLILLIYSLLSLHLSAQDDKHKVVLPDGDWEFGGAETEFSSGDQVKLKYNGTKFVSKIELIALPTRITVTPATLTLEVGNTMSLTAEIYPDNAENKNVTWESSNTSVATVDATTSLTTTVTAVAPGTAKITVTTEDNNKSAEISITVPVPSFSVSMTKKVVFSSGNLQYNKTDSKFQFASQQTECLGENQGDVIDLFGWGMWLDEFAKDVSKITNTSKTGSDYAPALNANNEFATNKTTVNGIEWFTLSDAEWNYLLNTRTDADKKYGVATINGVNGLIFLPDEFVLPGGVMFISGVSDNSDADYYEYTAEMWVKLEENGAVFLPACGSRHGTDVNYVSENGACWSSTAYKSSLSYAFGFGSNMVMLQFTSRDMGFSVRLVRKVE